MNCEQPDPKRRAALARHAARSAGVSIDEEFGDTLSIAERRRLVTLFRRTLIPARRPGRKRRTEITLAYEDWKAGVRGLALYKKHIRGWDRMSHWRRRVESQRLSNAVHTRHARDQKAVRKEISLTKSEERQPDKTEWAN